MREKRGGGEKRRHRRRETDRQTESDKQTVRQRREDKHAHPCISKFIQIAE